MHAARAFSHVLTVALSLPFATVDSASSRAAPSSGTWDEDAGTGAEIYCMVFV